MDVSSLEAQKHYQGEWKVLQSEPSQAKKRSSRASTAETHHFDMLFVI